MGEHLGAWCECGHVTKWHDDTGRCHHEASRFDHATQSNINVPCECFTLRIGDIVIDTWPDACKQCGEEHKYIDPDTELCGRCRKEHP